MKHKIFSISFIYLLSGFLAFKCFSQPVKQLPLAEIPFSFDRSVLIIEVTINGKGPFNFVLDTGSDIATIDTKTAKEIGVELKAYGGQISGGGSEKSTTYLTKLYSFSIGNLTINDVNCVVVDLSKSSELLGKPLNGVIGYQFLKDRIVQFDYSKHIIYFYSENPFEKIKRVQNNEHRFILPFSLKDDSPVIKDVYVNGKKVKTVLDTGGGGVYFALMPETIEKLNLKQEFENAEAGNKSAGANGEIQSRKGKIKSLQVGKTYIDSPIVIFYPRGVGKDNRKFGAAIGNAFLKDYVVTFDYHNKIVIFEKI